MPGIGTARLLDCVAIVSEYSDERAVSVADVEAGACPRLMETVAVSSTVRALGVGAGGKCPRAPWTLVVCGLDCAAPESSWASILLSPTPTRLTSAQGGEEDVGSSADGAPAQGWNRRI